MTTLNKAHLFASLLLLATFFLPWVAWKDASLSGNALPADQFFQLAKEKFGVNNPFPQIGWAFKLFWFIPVAAALVIAFIFLKKETFWPALVAGLLSLSLVLVYFLFSKNIVDQLGVAKSVWAMVKPWLFMQAVAAVAIVLTAGEGKWLFKSGLVLATIVATVVGFGIVSKQAEKKVLGEEFESTGKAKADYTLNASDLLKEFTSNDTAASAKYRDKVVEVSGAVSAVDISADSTSTLKFEDSSGSYVIFPVEKKDIESVKAIKAGDTISVKGVFSSSMFSDILGTTKVDFIRSVLIK